jgi:ribosomal protein S18 acetylase RimI-like enzyme
LTRDAGTPFSCRDRREPAAGVWLDACRGRPPEERFTSVNGVPPHYLDWGAKAAVDCRRSAELSAEAGFGPPDDPAHAAILQGAGIRHPEYDDVKAPALNIAVVFDGPIPVRPDDSAPYKRFLKLAEQRDIVGAQIRDFERRVRRGGRSSCGTRRTAGSSPKRHNRRRSCRSCGSSCFDGDVVEPRSRWPPPERGSRGWRSGRLRRSASADVTRRARENSAEGGSVADLAITRASVDDAEAIARLVSDLGYPTSADEMRRRLVTIAANDDYETLVARRHGVVVGFVGTRVGHVYEADEPFGQVMALAVATGEQRRGLGRMLITAAESGMVARGARVLVVTSGIHRAGAHAFYESCGYSFTGRRYKKVVETSA